MPYFAPLAILTPRAIALNLLGHFAVAQVGALAWAGDGSLIPIQEFAASVGNRSEPVFPYIATETDEDAVVYGGDSIDGLYRVQFEMVIENPDPNTATANAKIYTKAVCSMILNCPAATLGADTGANGNDIRCQEIITGFEPIGTNDQQNDFFQEVKIRAEFTLFAARS